MMLNIKSQIKVPLISALVTREVQGKGLVSAAAKSSQRPCTTPEADWIGKMTCMKTNTVKTTDFHLVDQNHHLTVTSTNEAEVVTISNKTTKCMVVALHISVAQATQILPSRKTLQAGVRILNASGVHKTNNENSKIKEKLEIKEINENSASIELLKNSNKVNKINTIGLTRRDKVIPGNHRTITIDTKVDHPGKDVAGVGTDLNFYTNDY